MRFTAVGDVAIQKRIFDGYEGFKELAPFIEKGDARFFNLETTLNCEGDACASQFSGGTYLRANPKVLDDLKHFGFNMTSFNNNHTLDFFYSGLERTLDALDKSDFVHTGVGRNLAQASAPKYLETKNGRVALISVNTAFNPSMMAGEQSNRVPGRPGINGLRVNSHVEVTKEDFNRIKEIGERTGINLRKETGRKEGYGAPLAENECELGELKFKLSDKSAFVMTANEKDILRIEKSIYEAKLQADYIIVSVHSHQLSGDAKENVPDFLRDFAHRCIDSGANAIIGHGPHLLRPIEVYKECPIFYSLGDFVLQLYNVEFAPEEFFANKSMTSASTVHELLKKRSKDFTIGLMEDRRMLISVIPYWETDGTKLTKMTLMPIEIVTNGNKSENGLPRKGADKEIYEYLSIMCEPYGTKLKLENDGTISCEW